MNHLLVNLLDEYFYVVLLLLPPPHPIPELISCIYFQFFGLFKKLPFIVPSKYRRMTCHGVGRKEVQNYGVVDQWTQYM